MGNPDEMSPGEEQLMSNPDAQEEANMLRAKMKQNPEKGTVPTSKPQNRHDEYIKWFEDVYEPMKGYALGRGDTPREFQRKPTSEDYDKALEAVEEMKKLLEQEPDSLKVLNQIARIANKTGSTLLYTLKIFSYAGAPPGPISTEIKGQMSDEYKTAMHRFEDAAYKLRELKSKAKSFSKDQTDAEKNWESPQEKAA